MPAHVSMHSPFCASLCVCVWWWGGRMGKRERESYNVVKDCRLVNHGGALDASKLLLLMSLHQKIQMVMQVNKNK